MATIKLLPSTSAVSLSSSYTTIDHAERMYTDTDSTTFGTFWFNRANYTAYAYLRGFDFSSVPSDATVTSFTVKIKARATGHTTSTSTSYFMSLVNNTSQIANTRANNRLTTNVTIFTFANGSLDWETLKGYGANFGIRIPMRQASRNTAELVSVYGAEILVEYTLPRPQPVSGFTPRLTIPSTTNQYYIQTSYGGLNPCIAGNPLYSTGSVLANCVGYAYGRAYEILGHDPHLSINQAAIWYLNTADGYPRSQIPQLGAVACWDDGGSGHVAIIEEIYYDSGGNIDYCTISESVYGGTYFRTWTIRPSNGWYRFDDYTFQGFIILPVEAGLSSELLAAFIKKKRKLKVIVK